MDLFGARAVAGIIGTLYSGAALGNLLGPVLAGAVFDHGGSYVPVMWACIGLSALAAVASARLLAVARAGLLTALAPHQAGPGAFRTCSRPPAARHRQILGDDRAGLERALQRAHCRRR